MSRRAWRVSYVTDSKIGTISQSSTVYYGQDESSAWMYARSLFRRNRGGTIRVEELASFDVGVPDDVELAEILKQDEANQTAFDMASPGNVNA